MMKSLTFTALGVALLSTAAEAQLSATIDAGYDDNPFRLSNAFDQRPGGFLEAELRAEHGFDTGFTLDARISRLFSQSEDGDRTQYSATLGFEHGARIFGRPAEFEHHVRIAGLDRTFISRNTGEVGRFGGQAIADRFDQNSVEVRSRADIGLSEAWTLRLQGDGRSRAYESYTGLGLSNLDYDQLFAHVRLRYRQDPTHDAQLGASFGRRVYDDRRGRALDTGFVAGSDLEFSFFSVDASWKYEFLPDHDLRFAYAYDVREDNVTGYYDTTLHSARVRYRYMPSWGNRFSIELERRDFDFDNIPAALIINDEENVAPNDGVRLRLAYDRRLVRTRERELWLDASLTYDDFDSPNAAYVYDRLAFRIGVKFEFSPFG